MLLLESLSLAANELGGPLPEDIGNMTSLGENTASAAKPRQCLTQQIAL